MLVNSKTDIISSKNFNLKTFETFSKLSLSFIKDFSIELRRNKKVKSYPDLTYLMFWCNNLIKSLKKNEEDFLSLGRGLAFHICPSNVPSNFVYSFIFGLLSGNSNIIKIPSKPFDEKKILLSTLENVLKKKIYKELKESNKFIEYSDKGEITKFLSSKCDVRLIWGGDKTINEVRKNWIPEKSIDITFADRYSFSIINIDKIKRENKKNFKNIVKKFYYDGYMMGQKACNSPHFLFWIGKKNLSVQNKFWNILSEIVEKNFKFDSVHVVEKYTNLLDNIIKNKRFKNVKRLKNKVFVLSLENKTYDVDNMRGVNGTFFQKNIKHLHDIKRFISKKCQTISYYGFSKAEFKDFLKKNNLFGVDRIVPIGKALEIDLIWDGYDVIRNMSRIITHK